MRIGGVNNMKKYKIAVAGTGYVGLSIATLLSQHHHETAVDIIPEKVEMINNRKSPIQDDYIEKYLAEKELNLTAKSNYTILTCVYTLIQWAVPVFLMISGNLLLHSNKLAFTKVKKMSLRMGAVLLLFGSAFALLEQVFERKTLERWCILIFLGAYYVYFFIIALFNHVYPYTSSMLGI